MNHFMLEYGETGHSILQTDMRDWELDCVPSNKKDATRSWPGEEALQRSKERCTAFAQIPSSERGGEKEGIIGTL